MSVLFPRETPRLLLRPFQAGDLAEFCAYRNDPDIARYQGWEVPFTEQQGRDFIAWAETVAPGTVGEWFQAAVVRKDTGDMIGDAACHIMTRDPRQAYIGYTFARAHQGQGYASEAVRCVLGVLFGALNLHRVVAECDVENAPSYRLLERVGFRREAHLVENIFFKGAYVSEYHYALLAREWAGGSGSGFGTG